MQRLRNDIIASVIALLVLPSSASSQTQEYPTESSPLRTSRAERSQSSLTPPKKFVSLCRGKSIPVSLLDVGGPKMPEPRRMSLLHGGISQRSRLVIRNRDEFNELWKQLTGSGSYKPPLPEVDFSREMIVVAAMGQKPSSGYEIIIDGACKVDNQIEVLVRSVDFLKCGLQLGILTAPVDIVRLPRTELPVVFRETEVSSDCKELLRP